MLGVLLDLRWFSVDLLMYLESTVLGPLIFVCFCKVLNLVWFG